MKTTFIFTICILFFAGALSAQSVTINPGSLDLPRVTSLPSCSASTKGRLVYNATDNKMYYCNGTAWINTEVDGPQSEPAFSAYNSGDVFYTSVDYSPGVTFLTFNAENYDVSNNFAINNMQNANTFIAPANGIYHFDATIGMDVSGIMSSSYFVSIHYMVTTAANGFTSVAATQTVAPVVSSNFSAQISRDLKLAAGDKVRVSVSASIPGTPYLKSNLSFFSGHLATKY
ncbi:hypothetical protein [Runella sp.]|uniref:hypothetical protein n=1 Tax=Runella sp. TaxID=1960881 RepID=UPI003D14B4A5